MDYTVVLEPCEEGGFSVTVPALPGCITEGDNVLDALRMAEDAITLYLESLAAHGETIPVEGPTVTIETAGVSEALIFRVRVDSAAGRVNVA